MHLSHERFKKFLGYVNIDVSPADAYVSVSVMTSEVINKSMKNIFFGKYFLWDKFRIYKGYSNLK